jgi:hypothetical protein
LRFRFGERTPGTEVCCGVRQATVTDDKHRLPCTATRHDVDKHLDTSGGQGTSRAVRMGELWKFKFCLAILGREFMCMHARNLQPWAIEGPMRACTKILSHCITERRRPINVRFISRARTCMHAISLYRTSLSQKITRVFPRFRFPFLISPTLLETVTHRTAHTTHHCVSLSVDNLYIILHNM